MFGKNKYDVMNKRINKDIRKSLKLFPKLMRLSRKLEKSEAEEIIVLIDVIKEMFPFFADFCNLFYENAKDIYLVDNKELINYLEMKKISLDEFKKTYHNNLNLSLRMLLFLIILEKENIDLSKHLNSIKFSAVSLDKDDILESIGDIFLPLFEEDEEVLDIITDEDFNSDNLSAEQKELIETYHKNYMEKNIFPYVSKKHSNKSIFKAARSLGRQKKKKK